MEILKAIDRLFEYMYDKKIRPSHFEKQADLANGYLSTQKRRNGNLGEDALLKILKAYPDIDANWLITGVVSDDKKVATATLANISSIEDKINYIYKYVVEKEAEKQISLLEDEIQKLKNIKKTL